MVKFMVEYVQIIFDEIKIKIKGQKTLKNNDIY